MEIGDGRRTYGIGYARSETCSPQAVRGAMYLRKRARDEDDASRWMHFKAAALPCVKRTLLKTKSMRQLRFKTLSHGGAIETPTRMESSHNLELRYRGAEFVDESVRCEADGP